MDPLASLQSRLGHRFVHPALLHEALTHPSYTCEHPDAEPHNQRLEFLGDSVLHLVVTQTLFTLYPQETEGALSRFRAALTNGRHLAELALALGLDSALRLGSGEESTGGRTRASNLEDAFEAVIGALVLDAGLPRTRDIVLAIYGPLAPRLALGAADNPKGRLQERIQPTHGTSPLRYETVHASGADHAREFFSQVFLADRLLGEGRGPSKKAAEESAARVALAGPL